MQTQHVSASAQDYEDIEVTKQPNKYDEISTKTPQETKVKTILKNRKGIASNFSVCQLIHLQVVYLICM